MSGHTRLAELHIPSPSRPSKRSPLVSYSEFSTTEALSPDRTKRARIYLSGMKKDEAACDLRSRSRPSWRREREETDISE